MAKQATQDIEAIKGYAGQYDKNLIGQMLNGLDIAKDVKVIRNIKTALNLTKLEIANGFRPLNTSVEEGTKPGRKYTGRKLEPKGGMKIFEVVPEELRDTWMGEMLDPNAKDVPFAQWVWEREFEKLADEINENIYLSEYHADADSFDAAAIYAPGDYVNFEETIYKCVTATTAGQSPTSHPAKWLHSNASVVCDGPGTIIAKETIAGKITPVITGAITNTNAIEKLRLVYNSASLAVRKKKTIMWISYDVFEKYKDDYVTRYGKGNGIDSDVEDRDVLYLFGSSKRCELRPCSWMGDSQRTIHTLYDNFLMGTNQLSDTNKIGKMVDTLHGFKAICKFLIGFNFGDLEVLTVNDQA